jgi:hypothetical protein
MRFLVYMADKAQIKLLLIVYSGIVQYCWYFLFIDITAMNCFNIILHII